VAGVEAVVLIGVFGAGVVATLLLELSLPPNRESLLPFRAQDVSSVEAQSKRIVVNVLINVRWEFVWLAIILLVLLYPF
jgi:hypothetical protein